MLDLLRDAILRGRAARWRRASQRASPVLLVLLLLSVLSASADPIRHGPRGQWLVALTFDACQTRKPAGYGARIVRILEETRTAATFLFGGRRMATHIGATRPLAHNPRIVITHVNGRGWHAAQEMAPLRVAPAPPAPPPSLPLRRAAAGHCRRRQTIHAIAGRHAPPPSPSAGLPANRVEWE